MIKKITDYCETLPTRISSHRYYTQITLIIIFLDSFIPMLPPEPFILMKFYRDNKKVILFSIISAFISTLGASILYYAGMFNLFDLMQYCPEILKDSVIQSRYFLIFISAFTPLPFKLIALISGNLHVNFLAFFILGFLGRLLRFTLLGLPFLFFGSAIQNFVRKYNLRLLTLLFISLFFLLIYFIADSKI